MSGSKPLEGLLVVAVEQAVAAPFCTARLSDAGARVIKIERASGDFARGYDTAAHGESSYFVWTNHGKESVVLDIKAPDDAALLHRIIAVADVFVQNLAPGALERAGFGSDALREANQQLITCDISGYGEAPGVAEKKAYDLLVQAESGLVDISGGVDELGRIGVSICDIGAGMTAHSAILEAIIQRSISGIGSGVRISLFDVAAEWMTVPLVQHEYGGAGPKRVGLRHPTIMPYGAYATSEGALTLISIQNEREWQRLCVEVLNRTDLATDPRFDSNSKRVENRATLEDELTRIIGALDKAGLVRRLDEASIAYGSVNDLGDLSEHVALRRRSISTSSNNEVLLPAHPVRWSSEELTDTSSVVPVLGADSERIRAEFSADDE
ncbi:MAG: CaiB/BaiF CoA-transferase family protein [Acidimicrobiales bacterium]